VIQDHRTIGGPTLACAPVLEHRMQQLRCWEALDALTKLDDEVAFHQHGPDWWEIAYLRCSYQSVTFGFMQPTEAVGWLFFSKDPDAKSIRDRLWEQVLYIREDFEVING